MTDAAQVPFTFDIDRTSRDRWRCRTRVVKIVRGQHSKGRSGSDDNTDSATRKVHLPQWSYHRTGHQIDIVWHANFGNQFTVGPFRPINHDDKHAVLPHDRARLIVIELRQAFTSSSRSMPRQRRRPDNILAILSAPCQRQSLRVGNPHPRRPAPPRPIVAVAIMGQD